MKVGLLFPVDSLSGAVGGPGGITFGMNQKLCVGRLTVVPDNPNSTAQQWVRGSMSACAAGYQALTAQQVMDWQDFAELHKSPILGEDFVRNAISEYCGVNFIRLIDDQALLATAPTGLCDFSVSGITSVTIGAVNLTVNFTHNAAVAAGRFALIKLTATLPSAVREPRDTDYRCIAGVDSALSIPDLAASPQAATIAKGSVGDLPAVDDWVGIQVIPVSTEYVTGVPYSKKIQVTAE